MEDPLKDILADLEGDDDDDPTKKIDGVSDDVKALKDALEEKEKKITGLLNEAKSQRRKRQDTEQQLTKLTDTVQNLLNQRQAAIAVQTPQQKVDDVLKGDYDEDGNPVIKADQIKSLHQKEIEQLNAKIASLEQVLQAQTDATYAESEGQKVIQAIVGSDERFGPAFQKYQTARKWVEDKVVEYQKENNLRGFMNSGQALDEVFDDALEADFAARFPNINLESVVTAEDSKRHLKNALSNIANAMSPDNQNEGRRLQKVLSKPSGLGQKASAKGAELDVLTRVRDLKTSDLLDMSDEQAKAIERALAKDETLNKY